MEIFHNDNQGVDILTKKDADGNPLFKCEDLAEAQCYNSSKNAMKQHVIVRIK